MQRELDVEEAGEISWPVDCPGHSLPSMTGEPPVPTGHSSKKATFNSCYPFIAKFHMRASSAEFRQVRAMTEKSHHRLDSTLVSDRPTHSARATDDLLAQDIDLACLANRELGAAKGPAPPPVLQGGLHGNTVNKTRCTAAAFGLSRKQKRRALDREFGHGTTDFGKRMLRSRGRSVAHRRRRRGRRTVGHRNRHLMPRAVRGTGQETQNSEGERGNGQETDLNFERLLLCNLGATGLARCAVRRLVVVAGVWPRLRCALTLSWLIERPTAHPLPTPTQKNQRALDRGIGCTTGGPMSHQDKVRTVWLPGLAICAPPSGTAPHHHGLAFHPIRRSFQSLAATAPQR